MASSHGSEDCMMVAGPVIVSRQMREIFCRISDIAKSSATVLIIGETGTGKEVVAREIHRRCLNPRSPFIPINCGAIPEALAEGELFGHKRGAFTGAETDRPGLFEAAHDGVLFLDEIGDMPKALQVILLRFLDSRESRRVGDSTVRHLNVRVVAATNRELNEMIGDGTFRSDLFYRLSVVTVRIPPLRERPEDVQSLAFHFLTRIARRSGKRIDSISDDAMTLLRAHKWPGNVRELQNVIESASLVCGGSVIESEHLSLPLFESSGELVTDASRNEELGRLIAALQATGGRRSQTASLLGMHRTTLWRKMSKYQG